MKNYELTYLVSPELSEEELKDLESKITSLIQEGGGLLNEVRTPAKKVLAQPIKKKQSAYLSFLSFQLEPEKMENLEKKIKAEDRMLRYLILVKPPVKEVVAAKKIPKAKPLGKEKKPEAKVELKEIEKKLEEILGDEFK